MAWYLLKHNDNFSFTFTFFFFWSRSQANKWPVSASQLYPSSSLFNGSTGLLISWFQEFVLDISATNVILREEHMYKTLCACCSW